MTDTSKSFARETLDEIRSKLTDANAAACGMIEQSTKRQHFTDVRYVTVRWEPYKPDGARQMKAKGRWQEQVGSGDYFRWANCDRPAFAHDPETIEDLRAQLAAANARADQAEYRIVHIAAGLFPGGFDNNVAAIRDALRDKPAPGVTPKIEVKFTWAKGDEEFWVHLKSPDGKSAGFNLGNPKGMIATALLRAIAGGGDE